MSEMHKWETVISDPRSTGGLGNADRLPVPGGWIYTVRNDDGDLPVFVPSPPRLVALEQQNGIAVLVAPASVRWIAGWGADGALSVICTGDDEATDIRVKGTPAEVARRIGLDVQGDEA